MNMHMHMYMHMHMDMDMYMHTNMCMLYVHVHVGRRHHSGDHKRHARYQSCLVNDKQCNGFVTSSSRSSQKSQNDFETTVTCVYEL